MVILGGLELVAAGYLLHEHNKNKRDRRELRHEAEALEDVQYEMEQEERRRRHRRDHSHDGRHHRRDSRERRHHRPSDPKPPYNPNVTYGAQRPSPAPPQAGPPRPSSVPPMVQTNYPPTGWPSHWEQSHRPGPEHKYPQNPNNAYLSPRPQPSPSRQYAQPSPSPSRQYAQPQSQPRPQYPPPQRGPSPLSQPPPEKSAAVMGTERRPSPYGPSASSASPHVRFDVPSEDPSRRYDPPPAYEA